MHYEFCWLVEDDVVWEDPQALVALVDSYAFDSADLVAKLQGFQPDQPDWFFWNSCADVLPGPRSSWVGSFDPICRISRNLIDALLRVAEERGRLCYLETIFSSLVALDGSGRLRSSFFNVNPPKGIPRMCIRWKPPFDEDRKYLMCGFNVL